MTNVHVCEALERRHFNDIASEAKTIGDEIEDGIKKRKEGWKTPSGPQKTEEERKLESQEVMRLVQIELQKKKQAEAASKASGA